MDKTEYVQKLENGDIRLSPKEYVNVMGPSGIKTSQIIISRMGFTFRWVVDFLEEKEGVNDEFENIGKKYKASRNSGDVFFQEIRDNTSNVVGFSAKEIPLVLAELQKVAEW